MLDSELHMQRHRVGARGNATSFPLPWSSLLSELQRLDADASVTRAPDLPRTGAELSSVVQVLLKTAEDGDKNKLAGFIHQAHVRRHVVVKHILAAKARGHRAYQDVHEPTLRKKAQGLPLHGIPPEIVRLLPYDGDLAKVCTQKNATPVDAPFQNLDDKNAASFASQRPNAVLMEKSSMQEMDVNKQDTSCFRRLLKKLAVVRRTHVIFARLPQSSNDRSTPRFT